MSGGVPPHSVEAEASVLGTVLLTDSVLDGLVRNERLRAEHFYRPRNGTIFSAMLALLERSEPIDALTLNEELTRRGQLEQVGGEDYVYSLPAEVIAAGNVRAYAARVRETWRLREKINAFRDGVDAAMREDWAGMSDAEGRLASEEETASTLTAEGWAEMISELVQAGLGEAFPFPFAELNAFTHGGMRRKQTTLIGGWTNTGKSILIDQILDAAAADGARAHLYINEMGFEDRGLRLAARKSGVPYGKLVKGDMGGEDWKRLMRALGEVRFGVTECAGWTPEEVAYDIRRNRWDVCAFDILHRMEFEDERDISNASSLLNDAAKRANGHLLIGVHLNEARATQAKLPMPALRDIRGSGSLKNDADNVLFVWREHNGEAMLPEGKAYFAKVRSGSPGSVDLRFNPHRLQFQAVYGGTG